jgi:hypothetical protein
MWDCRVSLAVSGRLILCQSVCHKLSSALGPGAPDAVVASLAESRVCAWLLHALCRCRHAVSYFFAKDASMLPQLLLGPLVYCIVFLNITSPRASFWTYYWALFSAYLPIVPSAGSCLQSLTLASYGSSEVRFLCRPFSLHPPPRHVPPSNPFWQVCTTLLPGLRTSYPSWRPQVWPSWSGTCLLPVHSRLATHDTLLPVVANLGHLRVVMAPCGLIISRCVSSCVTIFSNSMFAGGAPVLKQLLQLFIPLRWFPYLSFGACGCTAAERQCVLDPTPTAQVARPVTPVRVRR